MNADLPQNAPASAPLAAERPKRNAPMRDMFARAFRRPLTIVGAVLLLLLIGSAIFAEVLSPYTPSEIAGMPLLPPFSEGYLLGTDNLGRDTLTRVLHGSRMSLAVGVFGAGMGIAIGIVIGSIAGYFGGWIDTLLMRIAELFQIIPALIVALVAAALFGGSMQLVILVIGLTFWPDTARIVRAQILTLKERHFVEAAKVAGFSPGRIIVSDVLPNALPPVIVQAALLVGWAILVEAGLSFLGVGDVNVPTWGQMLSAAQVSLSQSPWLSIIPGVAVVLSVLAFNFLADGLNRALNPRRLSVAVDYRKLSEAREAKAATAASASNTDVLGIDAAGTGAAGDVASSTDESSTDESNADAPGADALLRVRDLVFNFTVNGREVNAVNGVSFHVNRGECVGIVGESGSGKSTIGRVLAQLLPPVEVTRFEGTATLNGDDLLGLSGRRSAQLQRDGIAMVFQDPMSHLNPTMKIGAQIEEAIDEPLSKPEMRVRIDELLERVDLPKQLGVPDRYPHQLSGGQRQRAMIALALAMKPKLLIADEPTTALDASVQAQVVETLLKLHRDEGLSILLISHDFGLIANMAERVYVMRAGRFVESAEVVELFDHPQHDYTKTLLAAVPGFAATQKGESA